MVDLDHDLPHTCRCGMGFYLVPDGLNEDGEKRYHPVSIASMREHYALNERWRFALSHYADCTARKDRKKQKRGAKK